jgi:hypothetical protein
VITLISHGDTDMNTIYRGYDIEQDRASARRARNMLHALLEEK